MSLYGQLCGLSRAELPVQSAELLDRVGLDGRQKTLLSKFSRGMLQRLGLAAALLGTPEVLVLDEPASGLDPVGQRDVRNLMVELKNAGATILLSSHQLSEVEAISDEVTILNRGRVAARGHIDALLNVAGQTSVTARGEGELPAGVSEARSRMSPSTGRPRCSRSPTGASEGWWTRWMMPDGILSHSLRSVHRSRTTSRACWTAPRTPMTRSGRSRTRGEGLRDLKAVVADAIRRKVLWIVVVFSAVLALAIPTLPSYGVGVVGCGVP